MSRERSGGVSGNIGSEGTLFAGIDLGATFIKIGIVSQAGTVLSFCQIPTAEADQPSQFSARTAEAIAHLARQHDLNVSAIQGIGLGAPGWVDSNRGIILQLTNLPHWRNVPIAEHLSQETSLPVFADNDANLMALGELYFGGGKGLSSIVCLTLGTGVGGGIILDGKIYRGANFGAAEVGHMTVDHKGRRCVCGARGCLERYVGNRFIVRRARRMARRFPDSEFYPKRASAVEVTPESLDRAARRGDPLALEVWRETGYYIGVAVAGLINLLNPQGIVIGGGIAKTGDILFDAIRQTASRLAMNELGKQTPIVPAQLGPQAGIIGAAAFAMERLGAIPTQRQETPS